MENVQMSKDRLIQMIVFELDAKEYGIPVSCTKEVIKLPEITEIPNAPEFVAGVINLRGNIICVIDLRKQFKFEAVNTDQSRIMIVKISNMLVGLIVDKVFEVVKIMKYQIDPVPKILQIKIPGNCLIGIAKIEKRIVTLINLENIFSGDQLEALNIQNI